jgi:ATP-dependent DNA ligase
MDGRSNQRRRSWPNGCAPSRGVSTIAVKPRPRRKFIEPYLPSSADNPPFGSNWIHEIKHDGYGLMARRDPVGLGLIARM